MGMLDGADLVVILIIVGITIASINRRYQSRKKWEAYYKAESGEPPRGECPEDK